MGENSIPSPIPEGWQPIKGFGLPSGQGYYTWAGNMWKFAVVDMPTDVDVSPANQVTSQIDENGESLYLIPKKLPPNNRGDGRPDQMKALREYLVEHGDVDVEMLKHESPSSKDHLAHLVEIHRRRQEERDQQG